MRRALRVLAGFGIALVAAVAAFVLVNQFDEDLSPEAAEYFKRGTVPALDAKSGFALVIGLSAPSHAEPRAWAIEWSRAVAEAAREKRAFRNPWNLLATNGARELLCYPESFDCLETFRRNPKMIEELALDNATLLQRYAELQGELDVGDAGITESFDSPLANYQILIDAQAIVLSQVAVQAAAGDVDGAIRRLEADAALHRRMLAQGRLVIAKMVAVRTLSRDMFLAVQVGKGAPGLKPDQWRALRTIVAPLTPQETALHTTLRFEAVGFADVLARAREGRARLRRSLEISPAMTDLMTFALPNATLNHAYRHYRIWEDLDAVATRELGPRVDAVRAEQARLTNPDWTWFYNPGGKALSSLATFDYSSYVLRVRDLDALARLACTIVEIREMRIEPGAVATHLAGHVPECGDPYSGAPMAWDAATKRLWFRPRAAGQGKRFGGTDERVSLSPY